MRWSFLRFCSNCLISRFFKVSFLISFPFSFSFFVAKKMLFFPVVLVELLSLSRPRGRQMQSGEAQTHRHHSVAAFPVSRPRSYACRSSRSHRHKERCGQVDHTESLGRVHRLSWLS